MIHLFTDIVWYYLLLRLREGMPWSFDFFFLCYRKNPQWWLTAQRIQNRREELCGRHGDKGLGIRNSFSKLQVFFVKHILWCFCRTPCPCILWVQAHTRLWFGISNHLSAIKYPLLHRNECSQHDQYSILIEGHCLALLSIPLHGKLVVPSRDYPQNVQEWLFYDFFLKFFF